MKLRLTDSNATKLTHKARGYEVRDEVVRGLILRVGKKVPKVWEVVVSQGKQRRRVRLGTFPALSVKDARLRADEAKEDARTLRTGTKPKTVADVFEAYKVARQTQMRTWHDVQSVWDVWAKGRIGHVRISDLTNAHGLDLRAHVAKQSSPLRAAAVVRYLRPMLTWAVDEGIITESPWLRLKVGAAAQSRDRVLEPDEWTSLWVAAKAIPYPFGPFTCTLMLSAQRLSTVAQMRWDEIHGDVWVIPKEKIKATRPKDAKAHEVPISRALADTIAALPRISPYVFSTTGDKPISPGSKLKLRLQRGSKTSDWRWHDLRRTGATLMAKRKVPRFIVERVLGHSDTSVTAIYDRSTYRDEKLDALEVLSQTVTGAKPVDRPSNVSRIS